MSKKKSLVELKELQKNLMGDVISCPDEEEGIILYRAAHIYRRRIEREKAAIADNIAAENSRKNAINEDVPDVVDIENYINNFDNLPRNQQRWITRDVLPSIVRTGKYTLPVGVAFSDHIATFAPPPPNKPVKDMNRAELDATIAAGLKAVKRIEMNTQKTADMLGVDLPTASAVNKVAEGLSYVSRNAPQPTTPTQPKDADFDVVDDDEPPADVQKEVIKKTIQTVEKNINRYNTEPAQPSTTIIVDEDGDIVPAADRKAAKTFIIHGQEIGDVTDDTDYTVDENQPRPKSLIQIMGDVGEDGDEPTPPTKGKKDKPKIAPPKYIDPSFDRPRTKPAAGVVVPLPAAPLPKVSKPAPVPQPSRKPERDIVDDCVIETARSVMAELQGITDKSDFIAFKKRWLNFAWYDKPTAPAALEVISAIKAHPLNDGEGDSEETPKPALKVYTTTELITSSTNKIKNSKGIPPAVTTAPEPAPKKRGRPAKVKDVVDEETDAEVSAAFNDKSAMALAAADMAEDGYDVDFLDLNDYDNDDNGNEDEDQELEAAWGEEDNYYDDLNLRSVPRKKVM